MFAGNKHSAYTMLSGFHYIPLKHRFAAEDSEESILFDEREEGTFKSSNEALIKACTIHKLIERLTYHEYAGESVVILVDGCVSFLLLILYLCIP